MSRPGLNRETVFATAILLVEEQGLEALSIAALAKVIGVKAPSLYNHIEGLAEVKRALSIFALDQVCQSFRTAVRGKKGEEALIALCRTYRAYSKEHLGLYLTSIVTPPEDDEEWTKHFVKQRDMMLRYLKQLRLDPMTARTAARALRSFLHGFVLLEIQRGWLSSPSIDESFEGCLQIYFRGIKRKTS